jgi:hypothetical protein
MATKWGPAERRQTWLDGGPSSRQLLRLSLLVPLAVLFSSVLLLTFMCHQLLASAEQGEPVGESPLALFAAAGGFLMASVAVVVLQAARVAHRVAGPEYRLVQAIRRMRSGDLSFRIKLRKGDMLTALADECNGLLDWLNCSPPPGCKTGTDVVDLSPLDLPDERAAEPLEVARP